MALPATAGASGVSRSQPGSRNDCSVSLLASMYMSLYLCSEHLNIIFGTASICINYMERMCENKREKERERETERDKESQSGIGRSCI